MRQTLRRLFWDPASDDLYWRFKGVGRLLFLLGIACYGIGLLLLRARIEGGQLDVVDGSAK